MFDSAFFSSGTWYKKFADSPNGTFIIYFHNSILSMVLKTYDGYCTKMHFDNI